MSGSIDTDLSVLGAKMVHLLEDKIGLIDLDDHQAFTAMGIGTNNIFKDVTQNNGDI